MLANLRGLHAGHAMKVLCFDAGVRDLLPSVIVDRPSACFIDGEHTTAAVLEDFGFCFKVCAPDAIIYFHDANVVDRAIERILRRLDRAAVAYRAMKMGGSTFAIALGERPDADRELRYLATNPQQFFWAMRRRRFGRLVRSLLPVAPD